MISLILKLIVTHLYGLMHGGLLGMQELEERYRDVMTELQKTEKALDDTLSGVTEDGKELKGVHSRLLGCYRSLYFDPLPDIEPKQQVNRRAKNMIEYVHRCDISLDTHSGMVTG